MDIFRRTLPVLIAVVLLASPAAAGSIEYPTNYGKELPRYPGARIVDAGDKDADLKKGVRIKLLISDPIDKVVNYYESVLKAAGWKIPPRLGHSDRVHLGVYAKGIYKFTLTVARNAAEPNSTSVQIFYFER